jgi:acyl-CoA synthetase (AMP-forming)/AMP-acid ligase II
VGVAGEVSMAAPAGEPDRPAGEPVACVNLTSGTTGTAKGVLLPERNLQRNAELFAKYFGLRPDDRTCLVLPLYFGMNKIALLAHLRLGATVLLEPGFATPNTALFAMSREAATGLCAVPAACQALLARGDLQRHPQPHLRYLRIGAGRVPAALLDGLRRAFPAAEIFTTYGLTEVGLVTCLSADEHARRPDSVGRPIAEVALRIEGHGGAEPAEVVVRADHAALGYDGDSVATAQVFREDGIHTGDVGRLDEAGYLFLTGRLKDLIKSGGENVHPAEIEAVLLAHPAVADCAVVGVPDPWL